MKHLLRVLLVSLLCAAPAVAQSTDPSGTWDVTINAPDGAHQATVELVATGEVLAGSIRSPEGELAVAGTSKAGEVSIAFTYDDTRVTLNGKVSGDTIGGPATFGDEKGDWTGKRVRPAGGAAGSSAPAAVDVSGTWIFEVTSASGTSSPTMTFNQRGEKLSGTYSGQLGLATLEGTVKGSQISFSIDIIIQDMKLHIVYGGTVGKDTIKGIASFGELGEGTFTAARK